MPFRWKNRIVATLAATARKKKIAVLFRSIDRFSAASDAASGSSHPAQAATKRIPLTKRSIANENSNTSAIVETPSRVMIEPPYLHPSGQQWNRRPVIGLETTILLILTVWASTLLRQATIALRDS